MAGPIDSSGPIEAICSRSDAPSSRRSVHSYSELEVGDRVLLCFVATEDPNPPYALKIRAPNGAVVMDRILRDLPTGQPQSEPPIELILLARGTYAIDIKEIKGTSWGKATLTVP